MKVSEAKSQVLNLIEADIEERELDIDLALNSPDGDEHKFMLANEPARVIHPRDGFYAKVNKTWFSGGDERPSVNDGEFYWYVLALRQKSTTPITTYHICDYETMRRYVLDLRVASPEHYYNQTYWRGELHILSDVQGYLRWGDEPANVFHDNRYVRLRNIDIASSATATEPEPADALDDISEIETELAALSNTERQAIIKSRIGQGPFRHKLLRFWTACSVTNCMDPRMLRASHIKPWRVATNTERLDVFNGLVLVPNLDVAFDAGLISFDQDGQILISANMDESTCDALGILPDMRLRYMRPEHLKYLLYHNANVFNP